MNEAALLAARRNKSAVTRAEFEEAIERVVAGLEKKSRRINEREKEIVAFHEAGHALVSWMLPFADRVTKVSIIPRGLGALGYTLQLPIEDRYLLTLRAARSHGRAHGWAGRRGGGLRRAVDGGVERPAAGDRPRAPDGARLRHEHVARADRARRGARAVLPREGVRARNYLEQTALEVDREVQSLVLEAQGRAREEVRRHREKLDAMAARLLTAEVVEEEEMTRLWGPKVSRPGTIHGPGHTRPRPTTRVRSRWPRSTATVGPRRRRWRTPCGDGK